MKSPVTSPLTSPWENKAVVFEANRLQTGRRLAWPSRPVLVTSIWFSSCSWLMYLNLQFLEFENMKCYLRVQLVFGVQNLTGRGRELESSSGDLFAPFELTVWMGVEQPASALSVAPVEVNRSACSTSSTSSDAGQRSRSRITGWQWEAQL